MRVIASVSRSGNPLPHPVQVCQHLVVPKSQHPEPVTLEPQRPLVIRGANVRLIVLPAIHLDNQSTLEANEVHNVGSNRLLPPESQPKHPLAPEMGPQDSFGIRLLPP